MCSNKLSCNPFERDCSLLFFKGVVVEGGGGCKYVKSSSLLMFGIII